MQTHEKATIVYIVPTRALVQQVELDFRHHLSTSDKIINITSIPVSQAIKAQPVVYVLTQERLHLLQANDKSFSIDVLVVDEAHKVGDGTRGILLQQVIEDVVRRNPTVHVIFSSPMTDNPEMLLDDAPENSKPRSLRSEQCTVNQNLIWASQIRGKPREWKLDLRFDDEAIGLGTVTLSSSPDTGKRLPFVAHALGVSSGGNLIYVNGAAEAEKAAHLLLDLQTGLTKEPLDTEVQELIKLVRQVVRKDYALAEVLSGRVAFHYGNIPLLIRKQIEALFKAGKIQFLVCTSTLVEGVNLPAKSIFVRGPKKGMRNPMSEADFWNLAGRAGRLGLEFEGNVFCVDPLVPGVWKEPPPTRRTRYKIKRSTDDMLLQTANLVKFVNDGTPRQTANDHPELEYGFVYLLNHFARYGSLAQSPVAKRLAHDQIIILDTLLRKQLTIIKVPAEIIERNPGISPLAMNSLLQYFATFEEPRSELLPVPPESVDAVEIYRRVIGRINTHLSGDTHLLTHTRAILVVNWMRGFPLARIISERISYLEKRSRKFRLPQIIRETMADIEEFARFRFPKYVSCYIDVLKLFLSTTKDAVLVEQIPNLNIWLEFGAFQKTQLSLMALGLSRVSAISVAEFIGRDDLDEAGCIEWIRQKNLKTLDLSPIILAELVELGHSGARLSVRSGGTCD